MKKTLCLLGIIALTVTIAFSMTGCPDLAAFLNNNPDDNHGESNPNNNEPGNGNNNNGKTTDDKLSSVNDASNFLNEQTGGDTTDDPVVLSIEMDLGYMSSPASNWQKLLEAIDTAGKYVELDLYSCTMLDYQFVYVFNPDHRIETGKDKIVSIILPYEADTITDGNNNAFRYFTNLKSISGAFVTDIGDFAFYNCSSLIEANFPQATTIYPSSFRNCTSLNEINFPKARVIGDNAFNGSGLVSADFPEVTVINPSAFQDCASLTEVSFGKATIIGNDAFKDCTSLRIARFHANPARTTSGNPLQRWVDGTGNFTEDSLVFYPNAFRGCVSLETLDVRNAWNVYFAGGALADIGEHLELYLFDDDGTKSYGHPQNDVFFSNTFKTLTIKAPVTANTQIEKHYTPQTGDSGEYVAINTGIVHMIRGRGIIVNVERVTALY